MAAWDRRPVFFVLALATLVGALPLSVSSAGELSLARFGERGELNALRAGKEWIELNGNVVIPTRNWKVSQSFGRFAREEKEKEVEGRRVWTGLVKGEEGAGFEVSQTVWQEEGRLLLDLRVKALGADAIEGLFYSCHLSLRTFGGGRFASGSTEGEFPKTFGKRPLIRPEEPVKRATFRDGAGQTELTFAFDDPASVRLDDGRAWERDYYWLAIGFHRGPMTAGQTACLRFSIAADAASSGTAMPKVAGGGPVAAPVREPQPIPDEKSLKDAEELIRDFFKDGFAKTAPEDRAVLARRLLDEAQSTNTDMDLKFVLLRESRTAALDGGHVEVALKALDATGAAFRFDAAQEKTALLGQLARSAKTPEAARNVADACLNMADESCRGDRYAEARALVQQAETAARNVKDEAWQKEAGARIREFQDLLREHERVAASFEKLKTAPDDPEANAAVGRFLCLVRGRWEDGLPRLAKGNDAILKKLAQAEQAGPRDAVAQMQLGEEWWQQGRNLAGRARFLAQEHAVHWLQRALPTLDAEKQEQVSKTIVAFYMASAEQGLGGAVFQVGNVALLKNGTTLSRVGEGGALTPEPNTAMLDGVTTGYTGSTGFTHLPYPCAWVVTLPKTYLLQEIRMLIWDGENRYYRYLLETSLDGKAYQLVADCSKGEWRSWQAHRFPPRLAKFIRLKGLYNSGNQGFHIVELEAYCMPPATPVTPKFPSTPPDGP